MAVLDQEDLQEVIRDLHEQIKDAEKEKDMAKVKTLLYKHTQAALELQKRKGSNNER